MERASAVAVALAHLRTGSTSARTLVAGVFAAATTVSSSSSQTFKVATELVTVPVAVTGRAGTHPVEGLTAADFRILEDGVEQTITVVDRERRPVSLCIVLDSSNSMKGSKQRVAAATVDRILAGLQPEDEASLVVFSAQPELALSWTPARDVPRIDWTRWKAAGSTALLDALRQAIALIRDSRNAKPVILVVSDGEETGSRTPLESLITTRRQSETLVYGVRTVAWPTTDRDENSLSGEPISRAPPITGVNVLPTLVGDSGGVVYSVQVEPQAAAAARVFLAELQSQYILGYVPARSPDGKYRRVKVEARDKSLKLRYRAGYLAMPH